MKRPLIKAALTAFVMLMAWAPPAFALESFQDWLQSIRREAVSRGISRATLDAAFSDIGYVKKIIELDRKQPEGTMTFARYRKNVISQERIETGRTMLARHRAELDAASTRFGVPPEYIVALWGIETSYGRNTGGFGVIEALATLAYDGRRSAFFRDELFNALRILDEGHITADRMKGSWAGAMGQNQFMPSSFFSFAVDGDGDGHRDIWTSLPDVFASTANYLSKSGWNTKDRWGRAVKIPQGLPKSLAGLDKTRTLAEWKNMGITLQGGEALPQTAGIKASLILPDGPEGDAFLAYDNFRVVMKWNKSIYFATSVGLLADAIAQR